MKAQCQPSTRAYIGLGANLGDRERSITAAVEKLREIAVGEVKLSSLWQTPAEGMAPGTPSFLNAVLAVETDLSPLGLLRVLQQIEVTLGRPADHDAYVSRTIDLDLLVFGDQIVKQPELQVPHPRMSQRRFVLQPLAELAPNLVVPGLQQTVQMLLVTAPAAEVTRWSDNV